jgi:two-component system, chemotaxis family, protein-glutamate methylesterase/glutaminase
MENQGIKVVVVEDSSVARELLVQMLSSDPDITVAGTARDGFEAVDVVRRVKPDVVTMDVNMPGMSGFEATRRIMESTPVPIVIITTSWDPENRAMSFRAMEAGAVTILKKPRGIGHADFRLDARHIINTVKGMSEIKVVTRTARKSPPKRPRGADAGSRSAAPWMDPQRVRIVALGVSTGGPVVLQDILARIPASFPVPIVVVQHIAEGFIGSLAEWLNNDSPLDVRVAKHGERLLAGSVYMAPGAKNMRIDRFGKISLDGPLSPSGPCPSVAALFSSVADLYRAESAGVLLTGMGRDGAAELKVMRDKGAITFAQDRESSTVFGMPGEAVRLDAARYVFPPERIAEALVELVRSESLSKS